MFQNQQLVHMTQKHFTATTVSSKMMKTNSVRKMKYEIQYSLLSAVSLRSLCNCAFHSMITYLFILFLAHDTG